MTIGVGGEPPKIGQTADEVGGEWHAASVPEAPIGRGARLGYDVASRDSQAGAESVQQGGDGEVFGVEAGKETTDGRDG